ncbi:DUF4197 domain-containing protein [Sulfurospirillum sp. 1307]|jgi:hypothetical protein
MKYLIVLFFIVSSLFGSWNNVLDIFSNSKETKSIASIGKNEQVTALKDALLQGSNYAVKNLSTKGGFLNNPKVKIPLPSSIQKATSLVKKYGGAKYVDDFEVSLNAAAEKAVPQTYEVFKKSIQNMSIEDARKILMGSKDSATKFLKEKNTNELYEKIYPIVKDSINQINVMQYYTTLKSYFKKYMPKSLSTTDDNSLFGTVLNIAKNSGAKQYMIDLSEKELDDYVTKKTIDGIFYMVAKEEAKIRENPLEATSSIAKKVFSAYTKSN